MQRRNQAVDGAPPERLALVIRQLAREDNRFHMEGGSWTNNISWVRGYESLLGPMEKVSALLYDKVIRAGVSSREHRYRNALFHLMASQTSCYRYGVSDAIFLRPGSQDPLPGLVHA